MSSENKMFIDQCEGPRQFCKPLLWNSLLGQALVGYTRARVYKTDLALHNDQ